MHNLYADLIQIYIPI